MERRFRWTVRQVLSTITETERAAAESKDREHDAAFTSGRLASLRLFFAAVDGAIGAFTQGKPVTPDTLQNVVPFAAPSGGRAKR